MRAALRATAAAGCGLLAASMAAAAERCLPPDDAARAKLVEYVHRKYKVPATVPLKVSEVSFVENSCYRKLQFVSTDERRPFRMELVVSPDFRFLTRELLDSRVDPVEEERNKREAIAARLTAGDFPSLGPKEAAVTLTLFSDFQCPFCAQMANGLIKEILPSQSGAVRVVFRNYPLPMHRWARQAGEAAACAYEQGNQYFWGFHDYLFAHQREVTPEGLRPALEEYASGVAGFNLKQFDACLDQGKTAAKVEQDVAFGNEIGIHGTPTLFVNGHQVVGFQPEQIRSLIRESGRTADDGAGRQIAAPR